jgi:hypothetical protein
VRPFAAITIAVLVVGCGWTPADEQVLRTFFEQSRVYDRTRLASVATTVFDPRTDGVVERFAIVERTDGSQDDPGVLVRDVTVRADVRSASGIVRERTLGESRCWSSRRLAVVVL